MSLRSISSSPLAANAASCAFTSAVSGGSAAKSILRLIIVIRRIVPPRVYDSQDVQIRFRHHAICNQIRQPNHRKFAGSVNRAGSPQHWKLPEHHRCLKYTGDHPVGRAFIVLRDPVAYRGEVVSRLWCEINSQVRSRAEPVPKESLRCDPAPAPIHVLSWRASMPHSRALSEHWFRRPCQQE